MKGLRLIKCNGVSVFLVMGEEYLTLIDTGIASSPRKFIIPYMNSIGLNPKDIRLIIQTHGHFDHMGGTFEIKSISRALVAIHKMEAPWIENPRRQHQEYYNKYPEFYPVTSEDLNSFLEKTGPGAKVDIKLQGGEEFDLDSMNLKVIHTPGHSPGSICLYDEDNELLITGDSVQAQGAIGFPLIHDASAYINSMKKLKSLKIKCIYSSHAYKPFGDYIFKDEKAYKFIDESLRYAERIQQTVLNALTETPQDLNQLQKKIADSFNVKAEYRVLMAADTFLHILKKEGKAESLVKQGHLYWKKS